MLLLGGGYRYSLRRRGPMHVWNVLPDLQRRLPRLRNIGTNQGGDKRRRRRWRACWQQRLKRDWCVKM